MIVEEQLSGSSSGGDDLTTAFVGEPLGPPQSGETAGTRSAAHVGIVRTTTRDEQVTDEPAEEAARVPWRRRRVAPRRTVDDDGEGAVDPGPEPGHWQDAARAQLSNVGVTFRS